MKEQKYEIGMVGLGVMGRNLLLNIADHGYSVAGYDKDPGRVTALAEEAAGKKIRAARVLKEFLGILKSPRTIALLVPAGLTVDKVIRELLPHLKAGDVLLDCGNSHFNDTNTRQKKLAVNGIQLLGVGVSGGEHGARNGPSLMPGGNREAYEVLRPLFEAIAAKVDGDPCVAYMGPGSAGHFVKMVHNGIEYGLMELIAESYDLMKRGSGLTDDELAETYERWNSQTFQSYLLEITARIFRQADDITGRRLIDVISDKARQKGTGKWTTQAAVDLQVPIPTIDAAVTMRDLSGSKEEREALSQFLAEESSSSRNKKSKHLLGSLEQALRAAFFITYAQGMALLKSASEAYGYGLDLAEVARVWRGGCIIRSAMVEAIRKGYQGRPELPHLLAEPHLGREVIACLRDLRTAVCSAAERGIPAPGMMASLAYFDAYRSTWLPTNLIQAQRDYFGAHSYERVDEEGTFHTKWEQD